MKTATTFPVDSGTEVELTCLYSGAENEGSSEVTCTSDTSFTHVTEPRCEISGTYSEFSILMMITFVKLTVLNEPVGPISYF